MPFRDRAEAGRRLADHVKRHASVAPIVLALPRGGVPVAYEVAIELGVPLEVFVARKLGLPGHEELGIGAIAEGSDEIVTSEASRMLPSGSDAIQRIAARERVEVERRIARYRRGADLPPLEGRDVILVDDGLATGVTAEAALRALRTRRPRTLVLAVPVCAPDTARRLADLADAIECVETPMDFGAVGVWYDDFSQTTDDEVVELLDRTRARTIR